MILVPRRGPHAASGVVPCGAGVPDTPFGPAGILVLAWTGPRGAFGVLPTGAGAGASKRQSTGEATE
jgi:hypothetical protein